MRPAPSGAMQRLLLVVTFVLVFAMAARTPLDSDLWWHLRSGEQTLQSGRVLLVDQFSHTRYGAQWVNHSWLSQVGMALLFRWGGYLALSGAVALLATVSMYLVYLQCQGPAALKAVALILGSMVASVVWGPRPQITSLVLLAGLSYLLYLYKWRGLNRLWMLPLVMLLWSNLHGGYALGFLLIAAVLGGELLNHALHLPVESGLNWRALGRLALWAGLSALAILVNPNGLEMWRIPFQTVNVGALQQFIVEWASPDFHELVQQTLLWLLFAVIAAVALSGRVMDGVDLVSILGFGLLALVARRNFGPFALAAVPVFTRYMRAAVEGWQERAHWPAWALSLWREESAAPAAPRLARFINLGLAGFLMGVALMKLGLVTHPALVDAYLAQQVPTRALAWVAANQPQGNLLNEYNWGGYIQWSQPATRVFVDGRTDLFGDDVIGDWIVAVQAGEGWREVLDRRDVAWVLLQPDRPLLAKLEENGWRQVYRDAQAVIYEKQSQ